MSTLARSILLGFFAAAGVGTAIALATVTDTSRGQHSSPATSAAEKRSAREAPRAPPSTAVESPDVSRQPPYGPIAAQIGPAVPAKTRAATMADLSQTLKSIWKTVAAEAKPLIPAKPMSGEPLPAKVASETPATSAVVTRRPAAPTGPSLSPLSGADLAHPAGTIEGTGKISAEGDGRLTINLFDRDLRQVLEMISQQSGMNILATKSVTGSVTASLSGVGLEEALSAILKSTGYTWRREGNFIFVGTQADFQSAANAADEIRTRVYRPNYVTAKELAAMITPLLTESVGKVTASTPAKVGIAADGNSSGGDDFAAAEAVVVRDYENVLAIIDQLVDEMDIRPAQVAIEAMILSVKLDDTHKFGVDLHLLKQESNIVLGTGAPLATLGEVAFDNAGLKFGFIDENLSSFISAVESIGDANIIATPRVLCLNRQRAEILIGAQLGYVNTTQTETSSTQSVDFLEVGTQLRIRPFISSDGMVRLEVHPELSTGTVRVEQTFTLPDKEVTQVTSNVMVRDGSTVVIGGLIRDELTETANQVPFFGSLPWVGWAFRSSTQSTERREILILITPHIIYEPEASYQGDKAAREFHHRHMTYADKMSPVGKRLLGRKYFHRAQQAWQRGNQKLALYLIELSLDFDPMNRQALDLRADITSDKRHGDHSDVHPPRVGPGSHPLDGATLAPWIATELGGGPPFPLRHPVDPGQPGTARPLDAPRIQP